MSRPGCCNPAECKITVVFARVGESDWYPKNLFCGWADVNLSSTGEEEAVTSGKLIKKAGYKFDIAYTSVLNRAEQALDLILREIEQTDIKVERNWKLNERHYGALTGVNKADALKQYNEEDLEKWRESYDVPPPPMEEGHPYYQEITGSSKYANTFASNEFPKAESLKMQIDRAVAFWEDTISPRLKEGKHILVVTHGNSIRGLVQHLDKISDDELVKIYLPKAVPFYYTLDRTLNPVPNGSLHFLGDEETVHEALKEMHGQVKLHHA